VAEVLNGARYQDGMLVTDDPPDAKEEQREAALIKPGPKVIQQICK
jgi:hypothetical protein